MLKRTLITIFLLTSLYGCDWEPNPPKVAFCALGNKVMICTHPNINNGEIFTIPIKDAVNYICTPPDDYEKYKHWLINDIIKPLAACKN